MRLASTRSVTSARRISVTCGMVRQARAVASAMARRIGESGTIADFALDAAPARTSSRVISPSSPVPASVERSTPSSSASARAAGEAAGPLRRGAGAISPTGAGAALGAAALSRADAASPGSPIVPMTAPTGTTVPGGTSIESSVPSAGASTSKLALSVSTTATSHDSIGVFPRRRRSDSRWRTGECSSCRSR